MNTINMDGVLDYGNIRFGTMDGKKWFDVNQICEAIGVFPDMINLRDIHSENGQNVVMVSDGKKKVGAVVDELGMKQIVYRYHSRKANAFKRYMDEQEKKEGMTLNTQPVSQEQSSAPLQVFDSEEFGNVRVVMKDGEPWFVAADVCKALDVRNNRDALSRLDNDEKGVVLTDTLGGNQEMSIVNEPGLYSLILSSRKPQAKAFKRWITHEVIPSIRKHGMYATDATIDNIISNPDFGIRLLSELKAERENRKRLEEKNMILQPKAEYYDEVLSSEDCDSVTLISKRYGLSATALNKFLNEQRVQYKSGGCWVLYQKYADRGYAKFRTLFDSYGNKHKQLVWTEKGAQFIHQLIKQNGICPCQ